MADSEEKDLKTQNPFESALAQTSDPPEKSDKQKFRLAPIISILLTAFLIFLFVKTEFLPRGYRASATYLTIIGCCMFNGCWLMFRSGYTLVTRGLIYGAAAAPVIVFFIFFRFTGFDGDLFAQFESRSIPVQNALIAEDDKRFDDQKVDYGKPVALHPILETDYAGYLGNQRNGVITSIQLDPDWDAHPPKELWRRSVGKGWGAYAIANGYAITLEQRAADEVVNCYELSTGNKRWSFAYPAHFSESLGDDGPRSTPTIHEGNVYTVGALGHLYCLKGRDGTVIWEKNILTDNNATNITWGVTSSPLIYKDWVIVAPGGLNGASLVAYDKNTGEKVWSGGDSVASYGSPIVTTLLGQEQILNFAGEGLYGHDIETGKVLWNIPWVNQPKVNVMIPLVFGEDEVYFSTGYGIGQMRSKLKKEGDVWTTENLWSDPQIIRNMKCKFTSVVEKDGYIYGLDDGILACVDAKTGEKQWKKGRYGHGQIILIHDLILTQCERGDVTLCKADPKKFKEVAKIKNAIQGVCWNPPVISGKYLLLRNNKEAACYEIPLIKSENKNVKATSNSEESK